MSQAAATTTKPTPTEEEREDLLLSCRYGDLEDVQTYTQNFGFNTLPSIQDENGNNILHMIAANGHMDILTYLLPHLPASVLTAQNNSKSTPLHWAALNSQLPIAKALIAHPTGAGADLLDIKNEAGRTPIGEAELIGWDEGARWMVSVMKLDDGAMQQGGSAGVQEGDEEVEEDVGGDISKQDIEIEIQDADGGVAKLSIKDDAVNRNTTT